MKLFEKLRDTTQELVLGSILITAFILLATIYLTQKSAKDYVPKNKTVVKVVNQNPAIDQANYHLRLTDLNQKISRTKIEIDNARLVDKHEPLPPKVGSELDFGRYGLGLEQEEGARGVTSYLEKERQQERPQMNIKDQIEMGIANEQYLGDYHQKYEKAYVNQFIENMETSGYEVELNDKLEVVRVKKIDQRRSLTFDH